MTTRSTQSRRPTPKWSRRSFWLAKPIPPSTIRRCVMPLASMTTSAPMALRLLRVPIVHVGVGGDEAVGDEQLIRSVIVEITELRAPRPTGIGDSTLRNVAKAPRLEHLVETQVVVLKDVTALRDVGDERVQRAAVERVAERDRHAALRFALEAGGAQDEASAVIVEVELLGAVVVGEVDVEPAVAVEVGRCRSQRPARAAVAHLVGDVLEPAVPQIVEEQVLSGLVLKLDAVVHDLRRRDVPQVDVPAERARDVEIGQAVAIVVDPDRAVAVHPALEPC